MAKIFHAHLHGDRETKYDRLMHSDISYTAWSEILPQSPFHLLIPQNTDSLLEYEKCWKITDIMPINSTGVKTHRDHFVIDFARSKLYDRVNKFRNLDIAMVRTIFDKKAIHRIGCHYKQSAPDG